MAWPKSFHPAGLIEKLKQKIVSLQQQWRSTRREMERLRKENEQLRQEQGRLRGERERLREENERLKRQLEEAQRANKRQAAPFSRGQRKANPRPPARKPGTASGQHYRKTIPQQVDQVIAVPLPAQCGGGGARKVEKIERQYQDDVVRKTIWRRFDIAVGRCRRCGRRVQGRDPRQTSDALGAAAVQLGPEALALAVRMNKGLGMPHGEVAAVLQDGFGLRVHRSTICRAVERVAVSEQVTYCDILPGRGFEQAASLLGENYDGWLTHDGWAVYYKFLRAGHQSCMAHLLRRCRDMAAVASASASRFPLQVKALLEKGLALRDRFNQGKLSRHGLWTATGRLEAQLDRLLLRPVRDSANRRLKNHLWRERPYLFTFLYCPGLDATNNAAERALRPLVVARKNWGGNRTQKGARAQAILTSILQTAQQQGKKPLEVLIALLVGNDQGKILDLVPRTREIPQDSSPAPPPRKGVACDLRGPSQTKFVLPPEVALYAMPKAVDGARVS